MSLFSKESVFAAGAAGTIAVVVLLLMWQKHDSQTEVRNAEFQVDKAEFKRDWAEARAPQRVASAQAEVEVALERLRKARNKDEAVTEEVDAQREALKSAAIADLKQQSAGKVDLDAALQAAKK